MALNKEQLLHRIHLLFCPGSRMDNGTHPDYWIPPRKEQLGEVAHNFLIAPPEGGIEAKKWLDEPNPAFGGKSPNDLLKSGQESDLEKLETAIRAIEEGAFS